MRKKMLMELKPLKVMSRYIADAKESEKSLIKEKGEKGKYRMYCRAAIEKGILKVSLGIILAVASNIKGMFIHIPCQICPDMN